MMTKTRCRQLTLTLALVAATLFAAAPASWAVPGDPDNDGLPTLEELSRGTDPLNADSDADGLLDGWEVSITATNPLDAHSKDPVTLDGLYDSDAGGISDGQELAAGADPSVSGDDARILELNLLTPAFGASTSRTTPVEFTWEVGGSSFASFVVQADGNARFDAPVSMPATTQSLTPTAEQWAAVTLKGARVYWRVLGLDAAGQRYASQIGSFTVTDAPTQVGPGNGSATAFDAIPAFTWSGTGFAGYKLVFTGSHKYGSVSITYPGDKWFGGARTTFTPSERLWKKIGALGSVVTWRVIGKDDQERWAYSQPFTLSLSGGATADDAAYTGSPDTKPTFTAAFAASSSYQILFSGREDFSRGTVSVPETGYLTGQAVSFTPGEAEWNAITALGPKIFWTVRGTNAAATAFNHSDIKVYDLGSHGSIAELSVSGLNRVAPGLPTFTLSGGDVTVNGYKVVFSPDTRAGAGSLASPADTWDAGSSWTMPELLPPAVADLGATYPYAFAQGRTAAGNSVFSQPYQLVSREFLRSPALDGLGRAVRSNAYYLVTWSPSPDDVAGAVLSYELQEAQSADFSGNVATFTILAGTQVDGKYSKRLRHGVNETVTYYYRVRALNSAGHSLWSGTGSKKIRGGIRYIGAYTPPRMTHANSLIMDDLAENNTGLGNIIKLGPGWLSLQWPYSYEGEFQYTTTSTANGMEEFFWVPNIRETGLYEVWVSFFTSENRSNNVKYSVRSYENGEYVRKYFYVDQNWPISGDALHYGNLIWASLGTFTFEAGTEGFVNVFGPTPPFVWPSSSCADAVAFKYIGPAE